MSLPPVLYHYFPKPLPYGPTLALQERLHQIQLSQRRAGSHSDVLLLLQHRPVYTAGRRQIEAEIHHERVRLTGLGADFVTTARGGQTTYHGPGQLVGYPLLDLSRTTPTMGIRDYICRMQKSIERYLREVHGIEHFPSEHTGVFLDECTKTASIGVQVRHRLTSHGFAMNVTEEPARWFEQVIACGLTDVKAGSIEGVVGKEVGVEAVAMGMVDIYRSVFERDFAKMDLDKSGEIGEVIAELENVALKAGDWPTFPTTIQ